MKLAVIGTGYVGLVAGAGFADFGNEVTCVDVDAAKIARLRRGLLPIYEPGLEVLVERNAARGNLGFTTDLAAAVRGADVVFIAVGTPASPSGAADLSAVWQAADAIGDALTGFTVVVDKSTVPIGTAAEVQRRIAARTRHPFAVVSNPEFLKEGDAIADFMKPSRVIVGTDDERARQVMARLYAPFLRTNDRLQFMSAVSAEMTKYAANALLATRISFMNEMARLAEAVGADVDDVRRGIGSDPRIGPKFLYAGAGYGGSCFPKDLKALCHTARERGLTLELVVAAESVNARQKELLPSKVVAALGDGSGSLAGRAVAVWGLAFKPGTDDVREAPAIVLVERLLARGARVAAYDPVAADNARAVLGAHGDRLLFAASMYQAAEGADALVLVTEWHELRRPDFARLRAEMRGVHLFDGRNIWDPVEARAAGFVYAGIGR
jgi:UDPglucose 6-dehydrogenase